MRLSICAVGRLREGAELDLLRDWLARAERAGRPLGLGPFRVVEVEDRRGIGRAAEAQLLARAIPAGAAVAALDQRGRGLSSEQFAQALAGFRDAGRADLALLIGGADGLTDDLRRRADLLLSLGAMVWPHMLVRAMLAEQLYRATQILAGTPYHRA